MKKFVLFSFVLLFGIVKAKAQQTTSAENDLPIKVLSFECSEKNNKIWLQWTVESNDRAGQFEVEKSFDGKDFKTTGFVFASEKKGAEQYAFYENTSKAKKIFYRLKLVDKAQQAFYSATVTATTENKQERNS